MSDQTVGPSTDQGDFDARVARVAALADPVRRSLYRFVAAQPGPVSREEAASGVGVPRHVAKFHLDKLVDEGLLAFEYRRPPGRGGPGAGRPAKRYRRADGEVAVSLPERRYDLAGRLLAEAVTRSAEAGQPVAVGVREAARALGRALGEQVLREAPPDASTDELAARLGAALEELGYEPRAEAGVVTMLNCPFHALAADYPDIVCGMNLDLFTGLVDRLDVGLRPELAPSPGRCCVELRAAG